MVCPGRKTPLAIAVSTTIWAAAIEVVPSEAESVEEPLASGKVVATKTSIPPASNVRVESAVLQSGAEERKTPFVRMVEHRDVEAAHVKPLRYYRFGQHFTSANGIAYVRRTAPHPVRRNRARSCRHTHGAHLALRILCGTIFAGRIRVTVQAS